MTNLSSIWSLLALVSIYLLSCTDGTIGQQDASQTTSSCNNRTQDQIASETEIRVGFLVGSQRRPKAFGNSNSSSYSKRPVDSRLLTHVFELLMNKLNRQNHQESVRQTIDLILKHRVHVILGPQETCQLEPTLASIFNVPMISHYCNSAHSGLPSELKRATAQSSFIQTKPPSWKIVRRVVALVRQLVSSRNNNNNNNNNNHYYYYPQQFVLLYFNEQKPIGDWDTNGRLRPRATNVDTQTQADQASASNEANQYNTIGRLLERELSALLRDMSSRNLTAELPIEINQRRRQKTAPTQQQTSRPSLRVLNWHTTFHYGYTENPFRRLLRRHLFSSNNAGQWSSSAQQLRAQQECSLQGNNDDQAGTKQRQATLSGAPLARASNANRTLQQHPASTYIIVGHSYEHLGLMLALDELGLLDFDGWPVAAAAAAANKSSEHHPTLVSGGGQQSPAGVGEKVARTSAQQARQAHRQPSIVIGVDIEPRDKSVRFLRGLLMGGADEHGGGGGGAGNNQRPSSGDGASYELSSLPSKYNHYMAIVPANPINPTELLDEMRQFYTKHDGALLGDAHELTTGRRRQNASALSRDLDRLTLLQFAQLPAEAYYLHDSIDLLELYFAECSRVESSSCEEAQRVLDECSRGHRVASWFATRNYSGHIDPQQSSGFDAESRAEGLYTIVARSQPVNSANDADTDEADEEFDIAQVGRFLPDILDEPGGVELTVEPASVHQVWLPLWCTSLNSRIFLNSSTASESCAEFLRATSAMGANNSPTIKDDNEDDQANARLIGLFCLFACMGGFLALMLAASNRFIRERRQNHMDYRMSCADSMLECFKAGNAGGGGSGVESSPTSECFNERDAKNFLHIVHNLLLNPENATAYDEDETNGELSDSDEDEDDNDNNEADRLTGQMIARESLAYSGSLRSTALEWQQQAEQEERETSCGIARLRDQHRLVPRTQAIDLHCYMFPFPSCKFVHWLTALHQLKEMLFKYQSSLSSKRQFVRQSQRWGDISRAGLARVGQRHCKSRSMFRSFLGGGQSLNRTTATTHTHRGNRLSNNRFKTTGISSRQNNNNNNCSSSNSNSNWAKADTRKDNKWMLISESLGRMSHTTFFNGRHRGSPTVKLLLNKYKSTNECLCQLASLSHPAVVRLFGITLAAATGGGGGGNSGSNGVNSAQLIVEHTGRSTLRSELAALAANVHMSASAYVQFKAHLWRAALTDLIEGLDYLHTRTQIGFHGALCATTCLVTSRWQLKLTGFHVQHMRRSLGAYKLNNQGVVAAHVATTQAYLAPEVPALNDNLSAQRTTSEEEHSGLLSAQAMRLADIYSLGFLVYELLVGQEPWSCVELPQVGQLDSEQQRNELLAERARMDPSFRPPISRLDKILAPILSRGPRARRAGIDNLANRDDDQQQRGKSAGASANPSSRSIRRLLESCWAHSPAERPQSLTAVRSRLETGLITKLPTVGLQGSLMRAITPSSEPSVSSYNSGACANIGHNCVLAHYTQLVEETARERRALLKRKQELINELRYSLLPCNVQIQLDGGLLGCAPALHTSPVVKQLDRVYLCVFRFTLNPAGVNSNNADVTYMHHHIESLSRILMDLDELVASFRGHLHLWDSQVDSMLRYTVCASDHLQAPLSAPSLAASEHRHQRQSRASDSIALCQLLATFAFELIDLANRWQVEFQGHVQVQCALHLGLAQAAYLLPQVNEPSGSRCHRGIWNLARCILLGRALQVVDVLEQSCQPQKIQVSSEFRRELVKHSCSEHLTSGSTRLSLIPSLLSASTYNSSSLQQQQQQQAYVLMRRTQRVRARSMDMETYWLLNGPRVTSSQRLTLPLVGARAGNAKSP